MRYRTVFDLQYTCTLTRIMYVFRNLLVNLQTSFLTPPFGFALFYLRGVAPDSVATQTIYRGVLPFIVIQLALLVMMAVWPEIVTWLPDTL